MPKFNLDINLSDAEVAEAREGWKGPLPPKGSYPAILKVAKMKEIKDGENKGKFRIQMVCTLDTGDEYEGCPVYGGVNLTEQGAQYVNQFLFSLVDTEAKFKALQKAFENGGPIVDEKRENITKIGNVKIDSPDGSKKILIALKHNTWKGETSAQIGSFLPPGGITDHDDKVADEAVVEEDDDDYEETDEEAGDESMFEDEDEAAE